MSTIAELMSLQNPVFTTLLFYEALLVVKMMAMSVLTGLQRRIHNAFSNPEDAAFKNSKVRISDDVERVRRAHLNDLENIPLFFIASFIYCLTNPPVVFAQNLIRVYTIARFLHTFVYAIFVVPQPARFISFFVANGITGYMAINSLMFFCS